MWTSSCAAERDSVSLFLFFFYCFASLGHAMQLSSCFVIRCEDLFTFGVFWVSRSENRLTNTWGTQSSSLGEPLNSRRLGGDQWTCVCMWGVWLYDCVQKCTLLARRRAGACTACWFWRRIVFWRERRRRKKRRIQRWSWWMCWWWRFDRGNFVLTGPRLSHESKCVRQALEMEGRSLWLWHPCEGPRLLGVKCDTSFGQCWFSVAAAQQTSSQGVWRGVWVRGWGVPSTGWRMRGYCSSSASRSRDSLQIVHRCQNPPPSPSFSFHPVCNFI